MNAQISLAQDASAYRLNTYEGVTCPACLRIHFINKTTGKLLGDKGKVGRAADRHSLENS